MPIHTDLKVIKMKENDSSSNLLYNENLEVESTNQFIASTYIC